MSPNEFHSKSMKIMRVHNLLKKETLRPSLFLTHKQNRDRLMLHAANCHTKGALIQGIGADRNYCTTAVACELAPAGPSRLAQLEANRVLIKRSNGLLADINGTEGYLSLGCSHTVAFCKTANIGGITNQVGLMDDEGDGVISASKLKRQSEFKIMLEEGWEWEVVPWDVDAAYPRWAKICQKALNGSNSVSSEIGELDTCVHLADSIGDITAAQCPNIEHAEKQIVKSTEAMGMTCSSYARVLMDFVKQFGGGPGAPHICFLDSVAKSFNCTSVIGDEFWRCITYCECTDKHKMPLLRVGFALCNLVAKASAPILVKADVTKAFSKATLPKALEAHQALLSGLTVCEELTFITKIERSDTLEPLGKFFVRVCLNLLGKGKLGAEGVVHSPQQSKLIFLQELSTIAGQEVTYEPWAENIEGHKAPAAPASAASAGDQATALVSLKDMETMEFKAKSYGFAKGSVVMLNRKSSFQPQTCTQPCKWVLTGFEDDKVLVKQFAVYTDDFQTGRVDFTDFVKNWMKGPSEKAPEDLGPAIMPEVLHTQYAVSELFSALMESHYMVNNDELQDLITRWDYPSMVRTLWDALPKGKIVLYPLSTMNNISTKPVKFPQGICLGNKLGKPFYITRFHRKQTDEAQARVLFWDVSTTTIPEKANMAFGYCSHSFHGVKIPLMRNTKAIPAYTELVVLIEKAVEPVQVTPKSTLQIDEVDDGPAASGAAKKKAKKGNK